MPTLIELLARIVRPEQRAGGIAAVAEALGGTGFLVFLLDDAVGVMLPAPGFPQTMPEARAWRRFIHECAAAHGPCCAELVPPGGAVRETCCGIAAAPDIVAVVVGTRTLGDDAAGLRALLPLVAAALRGERAAAHAHAQLRIARDAAAHAEAMAATLDRTRVELQRALAEAERVRVELEQANVQLQDQATELEAQAEELEAQGSELRDANAELTEARDAAQESSRAKGEFLATMSHELRTPLNAIGGHAELIDMEIYGPVAPPQREALDRIRRSQRHLLGLINDVLNLARIDAGRVSYMIEAVDLAEVLRDLEPMISPQLREKKLAYRVEWDSARVVVQADREKLQQVLLNLLSNAVKFTESGGAITVDAERVDAAAAVLVHVRDTGIGIPAEKLDHIFEPFVQVDARHSRIGQGVGLGLAISRDLARGMGGELRVRSTVGEGSEFTVTLRPAGKAVGTSMHELSTDSVTGERH